MLGPFGCGLKQLVFVSNSDAQAAATQFLVQGALQRWLERNIADLGITLLELLAYTADQLSYFQDAVANEAYLGTARHRISAKRHARLMDYRMHDGKNAWTFAHLAVSGTGEIPQGTRLLTRISVPLQSQESPPGVVVSPALMTDSAYESDPALAYVRVFETTFLLEVHPENNTIYLHTWGDLECCLPRDATAAALYALDPLLLQRVIRPRLSASDYLLLEEVMSPVTGAAADADPTHRQVVRLVKVQDTEDPVYKDTLDESGRLQPWQAGDSQSPPEPSLPLLKVSWRRQDALSFPLCVSAKPVGKELLSNVSVARGNMVLADHGRTISSEEHIPVPSPVPADTPVVLELKQVPLTMQRQPAAGADGDAGQVLATPRTDLLCESCEVIPAIELLVQLPLGQGTETRPWQVVCDLLDSTCYDEHFVVDVDNGGRASLRFGDGIYGREPAGATRFTASYRVGNGRQGNIGAESLAHAVGPSGSSWPTISEVRNPLAAQGGMDPETIEEVRQRAPQAFRAEQYRAVTEKDYTAAALEVCGVSGAVAELRFTGSWTTVFVGIDPSDPDDLYTDKEGRIWLSGSLEQRVREYLDRYRLAGYDLEVRCGSYVALEVDLELCVQPEHFRGDVVLAVSRALSNRVNPDGTHGFFHPDTFTFGEPVYLSRVYAAVEAVSGVDSVVVSRFQRFGRDSEKELEKGVVSMDAWEIARLDNDVNYMENGVLRIKARGGK